MSLLEVDSTVLPALGSIAPSALVSPQCGVLSGGLSLSCDALASVCLDLTLSPVSLFINFFPTPSGLSVPLPPLSSALSCSPLSCAQATSVKLTSQKLLMDLV